MHTILGNSKNTPQYGQCQKDAVLDLEKLNTFAYYTTLYSYCCFCHLSSDQAKNSSRYCKRDVYLLQSIKFASWLLLLCSTISMLLWLRLGTNVKFCTTALTLLFYQIESSKNGSFLVLISSLYRD